MTENTDLTTTAPMSPADVPDGLVDIAWDAFLSSARDVGPGTLREVLAVVLPLYGGAVIANAGVEHYQRQEAVARELTGRAARVAMLMDLASEAQGVANSGVEPVLNNKLAQMLRDRAHREGAKP
jgi:hypothetical protein